MKNSLSLPSQHNTSKALERQKDEILPKEMPIFDIQVDTNNAVAMAVFSSALKKAVSLTDSSEPDSLGDQLFRCSLMYAWKQRSGPVTDKDFLTEVCALMNQYEREKFVAHHPHMRYAQYIVI